MNDPLSELARKIRSKKLNKEEIENLKKEAIESKIERNRRIKKAIEIQRIIRGYLARKKFKILEDKININTIIEYLYEKKVKRIHKHSSQIISYFIYKYIERQRKIKTQLIEEFKIHCSDVIKAFIRGCILRKKIKSQLELIHNSKQKIIPYILSFKTRLILKSRTIQNILMDIANIKFLLQDENEQNQNIQDKQSIKDLKLKLRKKYNEFYLIYYQFKMTYEWVDEERTPNPWLKKYQQILNGEDVSFMQKDTNNNNVKQTKEKSQRKNNKEINMKNNNIIPEFESENNIDSNYNEEYENNDMNLNNDNYSNSNIAPNQKVFYKEDERPIKPMKNNNFMNSQNPFGLSENGFPEDHTYNMNNNNNKRKSQRTKIKRNKINKNENNLNKNNEEEKQQQMMNKDNFEENNNNIIINNNNFNSNNKNYASYDERPIGGNKIDYNAMFDDNNINIEADGFGGANQQININKKKIIKKNSPKKKPVYDARKAIEEAKLREAKEGKKEKPSAFREFVKEMKKLSAEEKAGKTGDNSPKLSHKSSKVNNQIKPDTIKNNNYIEENIDNYQNNENQENQQKEKRIPVHKRKPETKDMIMRKKLHQLEQSPPPMLNIKGIKSKIECWGPSNDMKKQKNDNKNLGEKDNKRINNINKKNNFAKIDSKEEINIITISKKETEMKNKEVDLKKIEEKMKKNAIKKLVKIESQINRIDGEFNIDSYFQEKDKKMEEFGKIPYIKKEYNYVKRYSNEIYPKLVRQLISQYQDLK